MKDAKLAELEKLNQEAAQLSQKNSICVLTLGRRTADTYELMRSGQRSGGPPVETDRTGYRFCGAVHLPGRVVRLASDRKGRATYVTTALQRSMNSTQNTAALMVYEPRIRRKIHSKRVLIATNWHKEAQCEESCDAAEHCEQNGGSCHHRDFNWNDASRSNFRYLSGFVGGVVSPVPTLPEVADGGKLIAVEKDNATDIRAYRDGHFVSLRSSAEMGILQYEQSPTAG